MYEDRVKWIDYKGKRILTINYNNFPADKLTEIFDMTYEIVVKEPLNSVLYYADLASFNFNLKTLNTFNKQTERTNPYDKGIAVIGTTGLLKIMYDAFSKVFAKPTKAFDNKDEALEWLANLK